MFKRLCKLFDKFYCFTWNRGVGVPSIKYKVLRQGHTPNRYRYHKSEHTDGNGRMILDFESGIGDLKIADFYI